MQVYAIFDVADPDRTREQLEAQFASTHFVSGPSTFFVATNELTSEQVAEAVGLDAAHRGVVIPVFSYSGWHNPQLWEWIQVRRNWGAQ